MTSPFTNATILLLYLHYEIYYKINQARSTGHHRFPSLRYTLRPAPSFNNQPTSIGSGIFSEYLGRDLYDLLIPFHRHLCSKHLLSKTQADHTHSDAACGFPLYRIWPFTF